MDSHIWRDQMVSKVLSSVCLVTLYIIFCHSSLNTRLSCFHKTVESLKVMLQNNNNNNQERVFLETVSVWHLHRGQNNSSRLTWTGSPQRKGGLGTHSGTVSLDPGHRGTAAGQTRRSDQTHQAAVRYWAWCSGWSVGCPSAASPWCLPEISVEREERSWFPRERQWVGAQSRLKRDLWTQSVTCL